MPARTLPNLGLKAGYDLGENGWGDDMTLNMLKLSVLSQGSVISTVSATPGSPTEGDTHIFDETHATQPNKVAVYDDAAWVYVTPLEGWLIYDRAANGLRYFNGTVWGPFTGGGALPVGGTVGQILTKNSSTDGDADWADAPSGGGGGGVPSGTSFPGTPATGDLFYRTDRHIEYFFDGTQWLSRQLFTLPFGLQEALIPHTTSSTHWAVNPFNGDWDIYIEKLKVSYLLTTATTSANYFSSRLNHANPAGAAGTNLGAGVNAQNNTQNHWTVEAEAINAVVASSAVTLGVTHTESGTCSAYIQSAITFRLVG